MAILERVRSGQLIIETAIDIASIIIASQQVNQYWANCTKPSPINSKKRKLPDSNHG